MIKKKIVSPKPKGVSSPFPKHKQQKQKHPQPSSDKKPKPSRKPSVLVSRQFNIADALSGYHKAAPKHSSTTELIDEENQDRQQQQQKPQKLIWKGRDGTPLPLIVPERLGSTTTTTKKDHSLKNVTRTDPDDDEEDEEHGHHKDTTKKLNTFEDIYAHFEKYRFDRDSNELNDEILKVANDNISVPWITDLMKDLIVKPPSACKYGWMYNAFHYCRLSQNFITDLVRHQKRYQSLMMIKAFHWNNHIPKTNIYLMSLIILTIILNPTKEFRKLYYLKQRQTKASFYLHLSFLQIHNTSKIMSKVGMKNTRKHVHVKERKDQSFLQIDQLKLFIHIKLMDGPKLI